MPADLTENEKVLWEATVPTLERLDLLTEAHVGVLRGYAMMYDQALRAHAAVERFGVLLPVKTRTGTAVKSNPALREARMAVGEMRACARELGCTPAAESAIAGLAAGTADPTAPNPFGWAGTV
ncbi:phage terminase small subunit P27 family [Mycobacterium sp. SMC-4]|uniref:phage terminase small subunit P27 family n=1 Tax=Mycobacterium sp. SMC-4 TaxID=2857059 RepID=UPI0021B3900C|nr:phage terminase small subunit P27 family [Mycobacterium sp. SMC-4]UXA16973.1 phage terminase small subunit P27 family [Mycobacterium sp. SMC-4]